MVIRQKLILHQLQKSDIAGYRKCTVLYSSNKRDCCTQEIRDYCTETIGEHFAVLMRKNSIICCNRELRDSTNLRKQEASVYCTRAKEENVLCTNRKRVYCI